MHDFQCRLNACQNPATRRLLQLMHNKKTNLALSADVTTKAELLTLADQIGPEICVLKTHIDVIADFDEDLISQLVALAQRHQFMLFEDRKFADIGHTTKLQYEGGLYHIADWAPIVTAHAVPGPGIIDGLKAVGLAKGNSCLVLTEMSSAGNLAQGEYQRQATEMALANPDFVMGFITQRRVTDHPGFLHFTPGVKLGDDQKDTLGQRYTTPEKAIVENGADIIIVGRGIYQASDPLAAAQAYRKAAWAGYSG